MSGPEITVSAVVDGYATEPRTALAPHGDARPEDLKPYLADEKHLALTVGGYLVRTTTHTVLVDLGVGTINNERYQGGRYLKSLGRPGIAPSDVDHVILTHLHFDHVGWATQKGDLVFPNARFHVHSADWSTFVEADDAHPGAVRKLAPLTAHLSLFDSVTEIVPGVVVRPRPGHTPGSSIVTCEGRPRTHLIGDLAHWPVELESDWSVEFDEDDSAGRQQRRNFAAEVADTGDLIGGGHFPELALGQLVTDNGMRRWSTP